MDEIGLSSRVKCFYLGLLPRGIDKGGLATLLKTYGKVLRLRLTKNKEDDKRRGHGYVYIELVCSDQEFTTGVVAGNPPIYAKAIRGPKHLGSEHTKTLRRCVKVIPDSSDCERTKVLSYLSQFGALEVEVSECVEISPSSDEGPPRGVKSMFALFSDPDAVCRLMASRNRDNDHSHPILSRLTFIGPQEPGIDSWDPPLFVAIYNRNDSHPPESPSSPQECKDILHNIRLSEVKDMTKMASCFERQPLTSSTQDVPTKRKKDKPTMNFECKRLACTINSNQLFKYSRVMKLLHTSNNLRYNLRISPKNLAHSTEEMS